MTGLEDVSPDGQSVIFDLIGDLYVLPIEGGEANLLTRGMAWDTQARYSPDGSKIAFVSDRDGTDNIWVMNADGSDARAITRSKEQMYGSPSWSPDGRYLVARRWGAYPSNWASRRIELWMFHIDGGSGIQITKGEGEATVAASPSFSPDGKYIYFSSSATRFSYNAPTGRFQVRTGDLLGCETGGEDPGGVSRGAGKRASGQTGGTGTARCLNGTAY